MQVDVKLTEPEIRSAISAYIAERCGVAVAPENVKVQVKSKQNYRSEWEEAAIRCSFAAH